MNHNLLEPHNLVSIGPFYKVRSVVDVLENLKMFHKKFTKAN